MAFRSAFFSFCTRWSTAPTHSFRCSSIRGSSFLKPQNFILSMTHNSQNSAAITVNSDLVCSRNKIHSTSTVYTSSPSASERHEPAELTLVIERAEEDLTTDSAPDLAE